MRVGKAGKMHQQLKAPTVLLLSLCTLFISFLFSRAARLYRERTSFGTLLQDGKGILFSEHKLGAFFSLLRCK